MILTITIIGNDNNTNSNNYSETKSGKNNENNENNKYNNVLIQDFNFVIFFILNDYLRSLLSI